MPRITPNLNLYVPDPGQSGIASELNSNYDAIDGTMDPIGGHKHTGERGAAPKIDIENIDASGTPDATTFLRGDGAWAASGGVGGVSDHGALTGLADDDHPQYPTQARGDARYLQRGNNLSDLTNTTAARTALGAAGAVHAHAAADVTSGVMVPSRLGAGAATSTTYLRGDGQWAAILAAPGPALPHAPTHALGGVDELTPAAIGAVTAAELEAHTSTIDTDSDDPHHTLGPGQFQAAAGTHSHSATAPAAHAASHAVGGSDVLTPDALGIDAANIAYKDEANTFALAQTFTAQMMVNGGMQAGLTATTAAETAGFWIPRPRDHSTFIFDDYTDELALWTYKTGRTAAISPPGTGAAASLFQDDVNTVTYAASSSPYPIVLTIDGLTNPITAKASSVYRLGVVLRPTQPHTVSDYVVEVWDTAGAGAWVVAQSGAWPATAPLSMYTYLLPQFSVVVSSSNITKLRLTLNGTNPLGAGHTMRIQRVILYHQSAEWDPWRLHRLTGGEVYGAVQLLSTLGVTGLLSTVAGATIGGTLGVTGKTTLSGAVAGIVRALGWYYELLPTGATLGPIYTVDTNMTITGISGYADVPATGSTAQFDIQYKRGAAAFVTIFSSLPGFAVGANVPTGHALAVTQLNAGDYVRLRWQGTPAGIADVTISLNAVTR